MCRENVNDCNRITLIAFLIITVAGVRYSACVVQSITLGRVLFSLDIQNREAEQRHIENRIPDEQIGSTSLCIANSSQSTLGLMRSQGTLETRIVRLSESMPNNPTNRGFSSSTIALLNDVEQTLMRKMTPTLANGTSSNTMLYRIPDALSHADVISMYSLNLLRNISAMTAEISTNMSQSLKKSNRDEYENNFCETARRTAAASTSAMMSPWIKAIKEMQTLSEFVSPALRHFDVSTTFAGCQDAFIKGARVSGVYTISRNNMNVFRAWCDFDSFGGWMVFQRRLDGTVDFFRRWTDYQNGFGNLCGEYWLGLDIIHQLTQNAVVLSIYMEAFDGTAAWANYSSFRVLDENYNYRLNIGGYSGTAGDRLSDHNSYAFTTRDRDNDGNSIHNCAEACLGAWWYTSCSSGNLNGQYKRGSFGGTFMTWSSFKVYQCLMVTVMRILV